jgi:hypothetical protein
MLVGRNGISPFLVSIFCELKEETMAADEAIVAMFQFEYVKDASASGGFKMSKNRSFSDPTPAVVEMIKRGMLKPEQLLG